MKLLQKIIQLPAARPLISSHTILLLCGVLFGMCVSEATSLEIKYWFAWAGVVGLIAFIGLRAVDQVQNREQLREAMVQTESRLVRHAHAEPATAQRA